MTVRDTILVVDDDARIRELLRAALESEKFRVVEAFNSESLFTALEEHDIDLITMDIMLERENGLDLMRQIHRVKPLPIILVTGRIELIDTVVGLELGADDHITKPFLVRELIARVRSVLRRARSVSGSSSASEEPIAPEQVVNATEQESPIFQPSQACAEQTLELQRPDIEPAIREFHSTQSHELIRFGDWTMNLASRELRHISQRVINLTTTEFDLLEIFVKSPQRVLSREQLLDKLTGKDWHPSDRVVDNHVVRLRKKLSTMDDTEWVKTVRGSGYLFASKTFVE